MVIPYNPESERAGADARRPYRPPIGVPLRRQGRWGAPFSVALHVLLALLFLAPLLAPAMLPEPALGAGGPGARGGGGGTGRRGERAQRENLRYLEVRPPPPPPVPTEVPPVTPPIEQPKVIQPAIDVDVKEPVPEIDLALSPIPGTGTSMEGTGGAGTGQGGGVGSGVGTGTGSATGPGTGGGHGKIYPPTPDFLLLAPQPIPQKVRGRKITLLFSVNERGEIEKLDFESSRDRGYDKKLRDTFGQFRFRPAVGEDGLPVAAIARVELHL